MSDDFKFRSGRLALDLAATLAGRAKPEPRELLATTGDLDQWVRAAGISTAPLEVSPSDLRSAQELREALYRLALACIRREPFAAADRAMVNSWAARPHPAPQLGWEMGEAGSGAAPLDARADSSLALTAIARDGVALFSGPDATRIRKCAACSILFVDASRAGRRRWCSMSACGNKAKVAQHRRRRREPEESRSTR